MTRKAVLSFWLSSMLLAGGCHRQPTPPAAASSPAPAAESVAKAASESPEVTSGVSPEEPAVTTEPSKQIEHEERTDLGGIELTLSQRENSCFIGRSDGLAPAIRLDVATPCQLHRREDGSVRVEVPHGLPILLVESSRPDPEHPGDCDTQVQAVWAEAGQIAVTRNMEVASCASFGWDQKVFSALVEGARRERGK